MEFGEYVELLRLRRTTHWASQQESFDWIRESEDELVEFEEAVMIHRAEGGPIQDAIDEAGDVLSDVLSAILTLEEETEGAITVQAVIDSSVAKLRRRKPFLFGVGPTPQTPEEENELWNRIKAQESRKRIASPGNGV